MFLALFIASADQTEYNIDGPPQASGLDASNSTLRSGLRLESICPGASIAHELKSGCSVINSAPWLSLMA